jgi:hypothetical protein
MADTKISSLDATNTEALRKKALTNRGALVGLGSDLTTINASAGYQVPFDAESYDTDTIHDNVTNNTRLTVPIGWTLVRVNFNIYVSLITAGGSALARIRHMNSAGVEQSRRGLPCFSSDAINALNEFFASGCSAPIIVTAGDYFELRLIFADTSVTISSSYTAFGMELLA